MTTVINYNYPSKIEFMIMRGIFFVGPMVFLSARPAINILFVDILLVILLSSIIPRLRFSGFAVIAPFLIVIAYLLGSIGSGTQKDIFLPLAQYLLVIVTAISFSAITLSRNQIFTLTKSYVYGFSISLFVCLFLYLGVNELGSSSFASNGRFHGIWGNPNVLSKHIMRFLCLIFAAILFIDKRNRPFGFFANMIIVLISFFLIASSGSFGGILFTAIGLSLVLLINQVANETSSKYQLIIFGFLICMIIYIFVSFFGELIPDVVFRRLLAADSGVGYGSADTKLEHINNGFLFFLNSPILGVGLEHGGFYTSSESGYTPFHSFYITLLVEGGLIAVLGFLIIFSLAYKNSNDKTLLGWFRLSIFLVFFISIIISTNIYSREYWFPFLICFFKIRPYLS
jgi:hypothetical protein